MATPGTAAVDSPPAQGSSVLQLTRPLVTLDLETTGVSVETNQIVSIALVKLTPEREVQTYYTLVNPGVSIPPETTSIHGITDEAVADRPLFKDIADDVYEFMKGCDLHGFNVRRFDVLLLRNEFQRCETTRNKPFPALGIHVLDSMHIFHTHEPRNLKAAYKFYCGKEHTGAHNALDDAKVALEVLEAQMLCYQLPTNVQALSDLYFAHNATFDGKLVWQKLPHDGEPMDFVTLNIGKYKGPPGKTLRSVAEEDPGYLRWMVEEGEFAEDVKMLVQAALGGSSLMRHSRLGATDWTPVSAIPLRPLMSTPLNSNANAESSSTAAARGSQSLEAAAGGNYSPRMQVTVTGAAAAAAGEALAGDTRPQAEDTTAVDTTAAEGEPAIVMKALLDEMHAALDKFPTVVQVRFGSLMQRFELLQQQMMLSGRRTQAAYRASAAVPDDVDSITTSMQQLCGR